MSSQSVQSSPSHFRQALSLLLTQRFGTFWFASLLANIGTWAQQAAQPWLLLSLGASPFVLGLDAFAQGAPIFLLTLVGGALADRASRRSIIAVCQSIQMLCPVLLVALLLMGKVQPWMVIALSLIVGITDALSMPSFQSIVPSIVARPQIASGIALNTTQFNLSRILGPAIAGGLMVSVGAAGAFGVSAASYVPFILVALWILPRRGEEPHLNGNGGRFDLSLLKDGVGEVLRHAQLRGALLTVFVTALFCAPLITFSPVLVRDLFHGGAQQFSLALSAFGAGGLLGALLLLTVNPAQDRRPLSSGFALAYGVLVVLAGLNPWSMALPVLLVLAGVAMTASNASANAIVQGLAPEHLRGQSVSLFMLAMRGGVAMGSLLLGAGVHLLGVREALVLSGLLAMVAHLAIRRGWLTAPAA
ncbi:MAG: MFS transporter [Burkholderiales bacterium]|jgi:predicted MFS family arabinose efflux permease|nr:MAG: MFS transporter [Burkholderiales bacterium]